MHDIRIIFSIETGEYYTAENDIYCIKYLLPGLVYIFSLQRFSCIFESTVSQSLASL